MCHQYRLMARSIKSIVAKEIEGRELKHSAMTVYYIKLPNNPWLKTFWKGRYVIIIFVLIHTMFSVSFV